MSKCINRAEASASKGPHTATRDLASRLAETYGERKDVSPDVWLDVALAAEEWWAEQWAEAVKLIDKHTP